MELDLARRVTDGLARWAARGNALARSALRAVGALGAVTWLLGLAVLDGSARFPLWTIAGAVLCAVPALLAWSVLWSTRTTISSTGKIYAELRSGNVAGDALGSAAIALDGSERRVPIRRFGRQLWALRRALSGRRDELTSAWAAVRSLTTMPIRLLWTAAGSVLLAVLAVLFALVAAFG